MSDRYLSIDELWDNERGRSECSKKKTADTEDLVNIKRLEELYTDAIEAIRVYSNMLDEKEM